MYIEFYSDNITPLANSDEENPNYLKQHCLTKNITEYFIFLSFCILITKDVKSMFLVFVQLYIILLISTSDFVVTASDLYSAQQALLMQPKYEPTGFLYHFGVNNFRKSLCFRYPIVSGIRQMRVLQPTQLLLKYSQSVQVTCFGSLKASSLGGIKFQVL